MPIQTESDTDKNREFEVKWCERMKTCTRESKPFERLEGYYFCCMIEIPAAVNKVVYFTVLRPISLAFAPRKHY